MNEKKITLLVTGFAVICFMIFWAYTNTNTSKTRQVLADTGYTNISTHGYGWFKCSSDDWSHTKFSATTPAGIKVSGVVCCGLIFKNCTVRYS